MVLPVPLARVLIAWGRGSCKLLTAEADDRLHTPRTAWNIAALTTIKANSISDMPDCCTSRYGIGAGMVPVGAAMSGFTRCSAISLLRR
jgi:hypothetical protein